MRGISFLSSATLLNADLLLPPPSPPALLHRYRPYASSVSLVELRRFLSAPRSAICTPRNSSPSLTKKTIRCQAVGESNTTSQESQLYQGVYGPWTVEPSDVREVLLFFPPPLPPSFSVFFYVIAPISNRYGIRDFVLGIGFNGINRVLLPPLLICCIEICLCMYGYVHRMCVCFLYPFR